VDQEQGQLPFQTIDKVDQSEGDQVFIGSDGRRGPAVNRMNAALALLLENDQKNGCLVLNPAGGVSRKHYASELNEDKTNLVKSCVTTLKNWDDKLREVRGGLHPQARAVLDLIDTDIANSVPLPSRRGRLDLEPYAQKLGVQVGALKRALGPKLKASEAELRASGHLDEQGVAEAQQRRAHGKGASEGTAGGQRGGGKGEDHAAKLQQVLEIDDGSEKGIVLNPSGKVSRSHYAQRLNIKDGILARNASTILAAWDSKLAERHGGLNPLARRFVEAVEQDRLSDTGIIVTTMRQIDVPHYAEKLGVSAPGIKMAVGKHLPELNAKLLSEGALTTPMEKALLAQIDKELAQGLQPRLGRGGKLHRQHYAAKIGVVHQVLAQSCGKLLEQLDERYGGDSNAEARIEEMRAWLEDQYDRGLLQTRAGKVDRKGFQSRFSLKGGAFLVRYPKLITLFEEFDARVEHSGYVPADIQDDLARLRTALIAPNLNKDRLTIDRPSLVETTGISIGRISRSPFIDELRSREQKILYQAKQSSIDPYLAGRPFVFSDLAAWKKTFLTRLGARFKVAFSHVDDKENIKGLYYALHDLLFWIGSSEDPSCRAIIASADAGEEFDLKEWELAIFSFRDHVMSELKAKLRSKSQADVKIANVRRVLAHMQPFFPECTIDLPGVKHARSFTVHRPSMAEATTNPKSAKHVDYVDYVEFAGNILRQAADRYEVDLDQNEAAAFIEVLADELERTNDLPCDLSHAVAVVLNRRLDALRDAAMQIMGDARAELARGQMLLAAATIDAPAFYREYQDRLVPQSQRRALLRRWFPDPRKLDGEEAAAARLTATANMLALAVAEFDGILPGSTNEKATANLGQFFQKRYREVGNLELLTGLLNPDKHACGAALTLYLIESGANVAVGRTLDVDCIEDANTPGYKLVTGYKARAKGKPIYAELPSSSHAIAALSWYAEHSFRIRSNVTDDEAKTFFVQLVEGRCQLATPHWYTNWFKAFASRLTAIGGAVVTPSMIRPSVLLKAALENDGRLSVGRAIGQHGANVTRGYQEKLPIRLLRDQHMRRFQGQFEIRLLSGIADIARALGIDAKEFDRRVAELQKTGLGTFCRDPYRRPGSEGRRCTTVDCWNDCPNLILIADVESIALLQVWQQSLNEARGDWERDHPERWGDVWLPWLCLTEIVEERMSRGKLLMIWDKAIVRAAELQAQPGFIAPRPY
jgi:hypothetical protein